MIKSQVNMNVSEKCGVGVSVSGYTPLLKIHFPAKKHPRHPLPYHPLRKKVKELTMSTINKVLNLSGLTYSVKHVKGVFHTLNCSFIAAAAPILILSGLSMCLIFRCLNVFSVSLKD